MKRLTRTILLALIGITLGACSPSHREPLRIGINPWPGYEFLYLAKAKGFFDAEGVEVRVIEFSSLTDALHAYERGQLDGWGCTIIELLLARAESNRKPQAVYVTDYSDGADVILSGSEIKDMHGLKGKRVGLEIGALGVYMLARALEQQGLTLNDVELVPVDQLSGKAMLEIGDLSALVTYPPASVQLQASGRFSRLFSSSQIKGEVVDVIAVHDKIVAERREDVQRLLKAFRRAQEYARTHPDEAYAIMARREGISAADFKAALQDGIDLPAYERQQPLLAPGGSLVKVLARAEQVLRATGQIHVTAAPETAATDRAL